MTTEERERVRLINARTLLALAEALINDPDPDDEECLRWLRDYRAWLEKVRQQNDQPA